MTATMKLLFNFFKRWRLFFYSIFSAILLLSLTYIFNNFPDTLPGEFSQVEQKIGGFYFDSKQNPYIDSVYIVNTSYDRELVDLYDEDSFYVGNIDISNRGKLLSFLEQAKQANNYKYIILDIHFKEGYNTPIDSALFQTIASMDRIIIPKHDGENLADTILYPKARYNDYSTTLFEGDFVKYEYVKDGELCLPYSVYHDLTNISIQQCGPFYFSNGNLCNKCVALNFSASDWLYENEYQNLGSDILDNEYVSIANNINNKYVVIGEITENDIHDTFIGPLPGAIITLKAIFTLFNNGHIISWYSIVLFFLLYTILSFIILKKRSITRSIFNKSLKLFKCENIFENLKNKLAEHPVAMKLFRCFKNVFSFVCSFFGFGIIFSIIAILFHIFSTSEYGILIPTSYFSFLNQLSKYLKS